MSSNRLLLQFGKRSLIEAKLLIIATSLFNVLAESELLAYQILELILNSFCFIFSFDRSGLISRCPKSRID